MLLRAPGPAAPHSGGQCARGDGLPERADRGRRAGGDAVRHLGRQPQRTRTTRSFRSPTSRKILGAACDAACRRSCSPRAAAPGSRRWRRAAATRSASTGPSIRATRARRVGGKVALQGNLDPGALLAPSRTRRARAGAARARRVRHRARPRLQSRPRHLAASTAVDAVAALVDEVRTYSRKLQGRRAALDLCTRASQREKIRFLRASRTR